MRFSVSAILLSAISFTVAISDLDASVWENIDSKTPSRTFKRISNRPVKREYGWNPPSELTTALTQVWKYCESTYEGTVTSNLNWGLNQIMANKGAINICVRWDSSASVSEAQRAKIAAKYAEQYEKWFTWLYGFDGFPYSSIDVRVVGWAVRDRSLLGGSTEGIEVYTDVDDKGIVACPSACSREAHPDGDYSGCPGGAARHFDSSLRLTDGFKGGFGYSWGQQVGREYFMDNLGSDNVHILLHEMGHTFGLDDFYEWTPTGVSRFLMLAGSATEVTDFDGWMLRNWWHELARANKWITVSGPAVSSVSAAVVASASVSSLSAAVTTSAPPRIQAQAQAPVPATTAGPLRPVPVAASSSARPITPARSWSSKEPAPTATRPAEGYGDMQGGISGEGWGQCGGIGYTGSRVCASGLECVEQNAYYSFCL